jgi:hypothetical protein
MIVGARAVISLTFCHYCQMIQRLKIQTTPEKIRWIAAKVRIPMIDAMEEAKIDLRAQSPTKGLRKHDFIRPTIDSAIERLFQKRIRK